MDNRLVVPKAMRRALQRFSHWVHPGRDETLRTFSDFWWRHIYRDVMLCLRTCQECTEAGKNFHAQKIQTQYGKLPSVKNVNDVISIDLSEPFKIATTAKKFLIVSIDQESGWPEANILREPTITTVFEFLINYIALLEVHRRTMNDPASPFRSDKLWQFWQKRFIEHIECLVGDHRGNGNIGRRICKKTRRLGTNNRNVLEEGNTALSEFLFALPTARGKKTSSPAEQQRGRKKNTFGDLPKPSIVSLSEEGPNFQLSVDDFQHDADSTILVPEGAHGSKLESASRKQRRRIINETNRTLSVDRQGRLLLVYCLSVTSPMCRLLKTRRCQRRMYRLLRAKKRNNANQR